jgi:hypothetical protein
MRLSILTAGAALLLCQSAAMAQTATPPNASAAAPSANSQSGPSSSLRSHVRDMLQKSGFSDIRVMPSSFIIHAKDQDGNPVVMSISPDSVMEVSELGTQGANGTPGTNGTSGANGTAGSATASTGASEFVSVANNDDLSSTVVGLDVYNNAKQDIGQIKDIAMGQQGRTQAYILSVGGFLGMGQHYVAVNPSNIQVSYNSSDKKWHATMNATADQLKAAPEFKYDGRWNASRT